ncbi:MAG: hypothetical protein WBJ37_09930 [Bacteroidales bacterium]
MVANLLNKVIKCFQPNGLSEKGLSNGLLPLLPDPRGGGFGGISVCMTAEMVLSKDIFVTLGEIYFFLFFII